MKNYKMQNFVEYAKICTLFIKVIVFPNIISIFSTVLKPNRKKLGRCVLVSFTGAASVLCSLTLLHVFQWGQGSARLLHMRAWLWYSVKNEKAMSGQALRVASIRTTNYCVLEQHMKPVLQKTHGKKFSVINYGNNLFNRGQFTGTCVLTMPQLNSIIVF